MRRINQYFICKPNTPVTKELDKYYEETGKNLELMREMAEEIGIESEEIAFSYCGDFCFIPTDKDLEKFKNQISKYSRGYYRFKRNTKIYKFIKEKYKKRNIHLPKVMLKKILNIHDDREFWFGKSDISCGFMKYEDTYLLEIDTHIINSDYLEELTASDYYKISERLIEKSNNK